MDAVDVQGLQRSTAGEALELSPHGTIGMVDARASSGVHDDAVMAAFDADPWGIACHMAE